MKNLILYWHIDPWIILFMAAVIWFYFLFTRTVHRAHPALFWTGILVFVIATFSPLNFPEHFYFSAHMIAHIIILLIAAPLIVAAIPEPAQLLRNSFLSRFSEVIYRKPWIAWFTSVLIMWGWHIPSVFNYVHSHMIQPGSILPALQSGSMLIAGMVFSWPVFGPVEKFHIHPLSGIIYLFTACISCSLLGLLIAFAPPGTYLDSMQTMMVPANETAPRIITNTDDLQAAGLIMWVPCCLIYLSGIFFLLSRYFNEKKLPDGNTEFQ